MTLDTLLQDAKLDDAIAFSQPVRDSLSLPAGIFLSGATGFLGVYLLAELLKATGATIYCLVRADDEESAKARLQQQLSRYQLWDETSQERIIAVPGDLSLPDFGLSKSRFAQLAEVVDVIYHNGAQVNASYSYARLKASNVQGTETILRLAAMTHTKPLHFVSTLAVFFTQDNMNKTIQEGTIPVLNETLRGGYKQSKWVAESLVREARERGLPCSIYRPGRIWGDSQTGIMERFSDLLCLLIQGGLHLKSYPELESELNIAPVDYVSRAIVTLSQQNKMGQDFHLNNPKSISWNALWALIQQQHSVAAVDMPAWREQITQNAKASPEKRLFLVIKNLLRSPIYLFSKKPAFDTSQAQKALAATPIHCPVIDETLMARYLQSFRAAGYIPAINPAQKGE